MDEELEVKYNQARITPFWHKLPFFFLFPFRFGPLIFLVCIVAASALAGFFMGGLGLALKGFLVYLGLRYAFNVLELFSKGRFEGESVDHRLWGPEKRPGKLGLVLTLFIVAGATIGNMALASRIAHHERTQEVLIALYKQQHAEELEERAREHKEYDKQVAEIKAQAAAAAAAPSDGNPDSETPAERSRAILETLPSAPEAGPSREQMIESYKPTFGEPLWFQLQPAWYWLVIALLSLLLPSAAVVIALEDNFFKALNPLNVLHLVQAMGSAYFVLWAFFLTIAGTRHLALTLGAGWPAALRFPIEMAMATYLGLVLFALMGYALYQFHQELHLDVDVDFDDHRAAGGAEGIAGAGSAREAMKAAGTAQDPWEQKLQVLVAKGDFKEAIAEVKDRMRYDRYDVPLNARLHALYAKQGDSEATLAHGQQWLTALARAGQGMEAFKALKTLQALDPQFAAADGDVVLPAATAALQSHEPAIAATLMRNFDKRFPQHKDTPGVYFLGAKLLSEQTRQHDKAARILRAVVANFPEHPVAHEARAYLKVLENLLTQQTAAGQA